MSIKIIGDLDEWNSWDDSGYIQIDEALKIHLNLEDNDYILLQKDGRNEIGVVIDDKILKTDYIKIKNKHILNNGDLIVAKSLYRY